MDSLLDPGTDVIRVDLTVVFFAGVLLDVLDDLLDVVGADAERTIRRAAGEFWRGCSSRVERSIRIRVGLPA